MQRRKLDVDGKPGPIKLKGTSSPNVNFQTGADGELAAKLHRQTKYFGQVRNDRDVKLRLSGIRVYGRSES